MYTSSIWNYPDKKYYWGSILSTMSIMMWIYGSSNFCRIIHGCSINNDPRIFDELLDHEEAKIL
jgi:hypothetical protein